MDYTFLPERLKQKVSELSKESGVPKALIRCSGNMEGESGEGYVLGYPDTLILFSKAFGVREDWHLVTPWSGGEVKGVSARDDKFNIYLELIVGNRVFQLKLSRQEESAVTSLLLIWRAKKAEIGKESNVEPELPPANVAEAPDTRRIARDDIKTKKPAKLPPLPCVPAIGEGGRLIPPLSPMATLLVALMYLSTVDEDIDVQEDDYICRLSVNRDEVLQISLQFYKTYRWNEFLKGLQLTHSQKLCCCANLYEMAMADGVLRSAEQARIQEFIQAAGITPDEQQALWDVLMVKNQLSVMES